MRIFKIRQSKPTFWTAFAVIMAIVLSGQLQAAPPPGKGHGHGNQSQNHPGKGHSGERYQGSVQHLIDQSVSSTADLVTAGITLAAARSLAVDAGFVGFKPLPPGIVKNLARGKPLPPGIATRSLPRNLLHGLPHFDGYEWLAAGTDLLLINTASRLIADVLSNALR